jgi:amino acid adenylation domain-containing protein/thioester reductase-like protein
VRRLAEALRRVLQTMIENRDARVWEIPLAEPVTCDGGPALDTPPVLDLIDDHSDAPAVIAHDGTLSHRDLAARAADVADRLRELGAGPGTVVGLGMPAGAGAIAALLGILRAGAAYLPLDPGHPPHRLATVLADAGAPILLTTAGHRAAFTGYPGRVLLLDERHRRAPVSDVPPLRSDIAYVIYTSGSSGEPKGVAVGHDALANLAVAFAERHGFGPGDRLLMVPPLSFDASVGDIFPALVSGAALVLPAAPATMTGPELMRECRRLGVTAIDTASALWQQWVADLDPGDVPESLRLVMVGGERVPVGTVRRWAALTGSRIALYNHYGPTEATVCATTYRTVDAAGLSDVDLPIGRPLPGVRAYVLDRRRRPAPPGVPGELYLGGRGVARGYLNRPEETAKRFLPDPFAATPDARMYRTGDRVRYRPADGELEFLGRVDRQVKIRGNRIEPGEVEAVLARHPDVRDAVVAATGSTLTAYVVGNAPGGNGFREWLAERLPDYMVPNTVVTLDALPLTRHGKVDLKALPRPRTGRPTFTAPRGPVEIALASLWSELLDAERVGADDDFFALGGHSLLIPTVIARVRDALGVNVPARALLQAPRLAEFAAAVHRHAAGTAAEPEALPPAATLHADARPPGGVRPRKSKRDSEPGAAFFTGGSGMLGVRLLADVLEHTDTEVHCLIRAGSAQEGAARLRDALATRDRWRPGYAGRIVPVPGDLTRPRFGLDQRRYDELARRTGTIYHSAALINILYPYQMLRPTNVDGTLRVLELAVHDRLKAVHFISTLGVFFGAAFAGRTVTERHEPTDPTGIGSTFATSKWVADGLVREARRRGVPATVYRLARVTGDSVTGESKVDDLFCRMLQTYVQLGAAPGTGELDISPVDYLARAIGLLSRQPRSINRDFHFRTSTTLPQAELTEAITGFGYPLDVVEGPEFWARFGRSERDDLGMAPFAGIRGLPGGAAAPILDCTDTERTVADLGLTHPAPDAELIRRYLEYFVRVGFLPAPRTVEAHHVHT